MKRKKIPAHLLFIRGSIGKKFVIRHTPWGIIMTKFPDMSNIKASRVQRCCRNLFKEAVAWAKQVIADPILKEAWQKKLRRRNGVYNVAIKQYMLKKKVAMADILALKSETIRKKNPTKLVQIIRRPQQKTPNNQTPNIPYSKTTVSTCLCQFVHRYNRVIFEINNQFAAQARL